MKTFLSFLLAALTILVFGVSSTFGIINLDDVIYLQDRAGQYGLKWAFTWVGDAMWTPLTWLSYWADRTLFGENWGYYHLHSVGLHALSSVVMFWLIDAVFKRKEIWCVWVAFFCALLWAIHPLRVESVVWLASRKDCISTFFFLLALLTWISATSWLGLAGSLALVCVGALGKSSVMVFPVFVLVIDFLIVGKRKPIWAYGAALLLASGLVIEASWAQKAGGACFVGGSVPLWYRLVNAAAAHTIYAFNHVFPFRLAVQCQVKCPAWPRYSIIGLVLVCVCLSMMYRWARKCYEEKMLNKNAFVGGLLIYFASLVPFLGIFGFGSHSLADRFTILPDIGLAISIFALISGMHMVKFVRHGLGVGLCVLAVASGWGAYCHGKRWEDEELLFKQTLKVDGDDNLLAYGELVMHYYEHEHDFNKIYDAGIHLLHGAEWQQCSFSYLGPILIEAAYETHHPKEAMDFYYWQLRWEREKIKILQQEDPRIETTELIELSEVARLAYTDGQLDEARRKLKELEKDHSSSFLFRNLRYVLARRGGDPKEIKAALESAYTASRDAVLNNKWALRWVAEQKTREWPASESTSERSASD